MFDVAFRGRTARTLSADSGGGLEDAIAKGIVETHHGHIRVRNHGPGCRFEVRIPLSR